MYPVQPKLLKHCMLTIRGVSIIYYYLNSIREELHGVLKYIEAASSHSEPSQTEEGTEIEADPNRRSSADD